MCCIRNKSSILSIQSVVPCPSNRSIVNPDDSPQFHVPVKIRPSGDRSAQIASVLEDPTSLPASRDLGPPVVSAALSLGGNMSSCTSKSINFQQNSDDDEITFPTIGDRFLGFLSTRSIASGSIRLNAGATQNMTSNISISMIQK